MAIAVVVVIGGVLFVLAPGGRIGGPPAPTPSPSPVATPSPTSVATAAPSAALLAPGGDVFPGTYVTKFDPPMTLTIDKEVEHNCSPGFRCRGSVNVNTPGWLDIEFGQPRIEIFVFRVDKLFDPKNPGKLIDPPQDLAAWIAARPGITVVNPPKPVRVGGLDAIQIDVRTGGKAVSFGPIPGVSDPGFGMGANATQRFIVVDVSGRSVVVSPVGEDPFLTTLSELQSLVDSIVWR